MPLVFELETQLVFWRRFYCTSDHVKEDYVYLEQDWRCNMQVEIEPTQPVEVVSYKVGGSFGQ